MLQNILYCSSALCIAVLFVLKILEPHERDLQAEDGQVNHVHQVRTQLIPVILTSLNAAGFKDSKLLNIVAVTNQTATTSEFRYQTTTDGLAFRSIENIQNDLTACLSVLFTATIEYPEISRIDSLVTLLAQPEGQEWRIRVEKNRYNEVVQ